MKCDRCGEHMRLIDRECNIFEVGYKPLGNDAPEWRKLTLCEPCQKDLRNEFYRRGLYYNVRQD